MELSLLAACPSLTDLEIDGSAHTDAQVEQIRGTLGHLKRFSVGEMETVDLARFLQPPVTARWQDIGIVMADARTGELLLRLPSLTKLYLIFPDIAPVDFLPQLPLLTALHLECSDDAAGDALLAALQLCSGITELNMRCGFNSAHWAALSAKLPLKSLAIRGEKIESLQCFTAGPITQSLEVLRIEEPPSELSHLHGLRRLRTLRLDQCLPSRLDIATLHSLSPPTPMLPALTHLFLEWWTENEQFDSGERHGPSFEWMQQRLSQ